ncbi:hypothetical protein IWW36_004153 [Coemansia brasiliensis]|uniref:DEK-C domain-containing protein n=1 Tax=Coemansia brasiliensis TaxID=2650707 RepID=A0A9W8I8U6_9FUNG|nr:hypothetical protein IWW36_004153 [Coemansia brasiliensis]
MRFVVFLDLFGTITMPTTLFYFAYLIYVAVTGLADVGYISLILIGCIYGVQAIIFILRREWQHVGWMIIYILAYPLWSFVLPVYSFWHMDDFSWGNTRVVVGDGKRKIIIQDDKEFHPDSIPQRKWLEYEADLTAAGVLNAPPPNMNPNAGSTTKEDERMSMYSRQSVAMMGQMHTGSVYGFSGTPSVAGPNIAHSEYMMSRPGTPSAGTVSGDQRLSMMAINNPTVMASYAGMQPQVSVAMPPVPQQESRSQSPAAMASARPHTIMSSSSQALASNFPFASGSFEHTAGATGLDVHQRPASSYIASHSLGQIHSDLTGNAPSDEQIISVIRRILGSSDLSVMTKKKIRQQLTQEFNVDLSSRKEFISSIVDRILSGQL